MSWVRRHNLQLYFRNAIWIFPAFSIVAGLAMVNLLSRLEMKLGWKLDISPETGRTVMGAIAGSMFTLVVVGSSAVLVAVQLASAQLTPRIIALVYRSNMRKAALALFVFVFTFSVGVLVRIEGSVPLLTSYFAAYGFLINLAIFLYFIDGMGKILRPSTAMRALALLGREVIRTVYPQRLEEKHFTPPEAIEALEHEPRQTVLNRVDGVLLAFDMKGLLSLAERAGCVIELVPQVGDFVAAGDPLFRIYQGVKNLPEVALCNSVALGQERTPEQDPMFAFRIIVDIASKALSPAINDPTTAVLAIDQIHHLLREVGSRYLAEGCEVDVNGRVCFVYRTPNWDDFVHLAVTEVRQYGRDSIQVMRRLRAMLENLIETLPDRRAPLLHRELGLLKTSSKRMFPDPDDQLLAETSDLQGMGGSHDESGKRDRVQANGAGSIASSGMSTA
jgi:uncharacterized membrane protein